MEDKLVSAAYHEAGHSVARWFCGLPATELIARRNGFSLCAGTMREIRIWDAVFIALAGPAAEAGYRFPRKVNPRWSADFDEARRVISRCPECFEFYPGSPTNEEIITGELKRQSPTTEELLEEALRVQFDETCRKLSLYVAKVDRLESELVSKGGTLQAPAVAAFYRHWDREEEEVAASLLPSEKH